MEEKKKIVIVEDDIICATKIKTFLEDKGFFVTHAHDGETALKILEKNFYDMVILDIVLPKIDGFTLAKRIRYDEKTKQIPIIILSGREGMKELFAIEGIEDYMVKPVNGEALLELVNKRFPR